jgi:hypothetical protein
MRLHVSADAANFLFVLPFTSAFAWNDQTKLMFPNGFIKFPRVRWGRNISEPNAGFCISAGQLRLLSGDKLSDLRNGMRRQFFGYLSGDPRDDLGVAGFAKLAQYLRGSNDDEAIEKIGVSMAIKCFRDLVCKTFLRNLMPIDLFHRASGNCRTCGGSSGTVRPLLSRRRIILFENLLDDQIDIHCAASVTQEKSLLTVADKNETVMGKDVGPRRGSLEFWFRNHLAYPPNARLE